MRGFLAVNLFLLLMIGVAAGLLFLSITSIRALDLGPDVTRWLEALAALVAIFGAGYFGKRLLATLEKRSRA